MLFIGIDWSQAGHNVTIRNEAKAILARFQMPHTAKGFAQFDAEVHKLNVLPGECLVAIETAYNLLTDHLLDREHLVYVIPPSATGAYCNRQRSSQAHDDETDADLLSGILITDRDNHRQLNPNLPLTQRLLAQVRLIEILRRSIQRQTNQLSAVLHRTYPQAMGLFSDLASPISLEFLMAYPTVREAQGLTRDGFETFVRQHGYTRTDLIPLHYAHLLEPTPHTSLVIPEVFRSQVLMLAKVLLPQVRARLQALVELESLFNQHPDASIFRSLPAGGPLLAPSLLAKLGDHRDRFPQPGDVQALAGTCPVTIKSGKRKVIKFRFGCDKEFRCMIQHFAINSTLKSGWAAVYLKTIRPHCDSDSHAYRIVANRWLAIIWKLWYTSQPYDEEYHLRQRAQRSRPRP